MSYQATQSVFSMAMSAAVLLSAGCDGGPRKLDATVQGTVTVAGELAASGTVAFHPVDGGAIAYGRIHGDGSYSLRMGQGNLQDPDGGKVYSGEYIATVLVTASPEEGAFLGEGGPPVPGARVTAARYASKDTSDLRISVKPGLNVIVLPLEAASSEPDVEEGESADQESDDSDAIDGQPASLEQGEPAFEEGQPEAPQDNSQEETSEAADPSSGETSS